VGVVSGWTVRKAAWLLQPGERFVFDGDLGGEGEVLTVVSVLEQDGLAVHIRTRELDFPIGSLSRHWVTMV
jgi:hypothetical protein